MAPSDFHKETSPTTNADLAQRLVDFADAIESPAAHEAEAAIREAAARLRQIDDPQPLIPRLIGELRHVALFSADLDARRKLKGLLGDLA